MPTVAFLVAASPTPAFFGQIAALTLALTKLRWTHWDWDVFVYAGGEGGVDACVDWLPHLSNVEISWVSAGRFAREGDWAQADDVFRLAPRNADVLLALDADVLPVADLEPILDHVLDAQAVAGVIAHYPFPRGNWALAGSLIDTPLEFAYPYTLVSADPTNHMTPFYVNFGAVFFPRLAFETLAPEYLRLRPLVAERVDDWFSGQIALTLATASTGVRTSALPMRYNFPNDPIAASLYPDELADVVFFHYLRTDQFDRHRIFAESEEYRRFLELRLVGVNRSFQRRVEELLGSEYPFGERRRAN